MRVVIVGGANAGKTTLANILGDRFGLTVRSTDDLIETLSGDRDRMTQAVADDWLGAPMSIVEGVTVPLAMRYRLATVPGLLPVDFVLWLRGSRVPYSRGQAVQAKGIETVMGSVVTDKRCPTVYQIRVP